MLRAKSVGIVDIIYDWIKDKFKGREQRVVFIIIKTTTTYR